MTWAQRAQTADGLVRTLYIASAAVYLASAFGAVWIAADRLAAWHRLGLIVIGLTLGVALRAAEVRARLLGAAAVGAAGVAALAAGHFMFSGTTASSMTAGALIILLPIAAAGLWEAIRRRVWLLAALVGAGMVYSLAALAATGERSAWLALAAAVVAASALHWRWGVGAESPRRRLVDVGLSAALLALPVLFALSVLQPSWAAWMGNLGDSSDFSRPALWRDTLALIGDYRYTGSGLGQTAMEYATYVFILHVPYVHHAYNLFLQVTIEQGLPGLVGFLGMGVAAAWGVLATYRYGPARLHIYALATAASLGASLSHGMVDAGLYDSRLMPILFVPLSFGMALPKARRAGPYAYRTPRAEMGPALAAAGALLPLAAVVALFVRPDVQSLWYANLGAARQAQAELAAYSWPLWPVQDALRRSPEIDLEAAETYYRAALAFDPANVTAHRRMGQIALSRGDYGAAKHHLEAAHRYAPAQRTTLLLLGELYAVDGQADRAVAFWSSGDADLDSLDERLWWYQHTGAQDEAAGMEAAIAALRASLAGVIPGSGQF